MASPFVPELGQAVFGAPWQEYEMPAFVREGLRHLAERVASESSSGHSPADNTGASFENDVFALRAYCWCEGESADHQDGCPPNFEHKASGFDASWYKYLGRGSSVSAPIKEDAFERLLAECIASLAEGGVRAVRERINSTLLANLPAHAFADSSIENGEASIQVWLPWPADIDPAANETASERVATYASQAGQAISQALTRIDWTLVANDEFHLTAPLPFDEDPVAAACYRERTDDELRAAGFEDPASVYAPDRLVLEAHSGINLFRNATRVVI